MGNLLKPLTIFVACPGDCASQRDIVSDVVKELEPLANYHGFTMKVQNWTKLLPDVGRPQSVIFQQVPVETWDILICILWLRFGERSGGMNAITGLPAESGTEEEFAYALESNRTTRKPRILFYRRTAGPPDISRLDITQFHLVQEFFKKFGPKQPYEGLFKPFDSSEQFRNLLREHLQELLIKMGGPHLENRASEIPAPIGIETVIRWRDRLLMLYDVVKLHRISSAFDAGSVLRADRDRVHLDDIFVPQDVCDVTDYVAERLPAPRDLLNAGDDELRVLGMLHHQKLRTSKRFGVVEVLDAKKDKQVVLLGGPGAGKSSLLQHRALSWARDPTLAGPIPLLLEMRQYAARVLRAHEEKGQPPSILAFAGELLGAAGGSLPVPEKDIKVGLSSGGMILYCDALDEIFDSDLRRRTAEQLLELSIKIPGLLMVVTSRPVGYPDDVLGRAGFGHWMIQDFNKLQIEQFLARWVIAALPDLEDRSNVTARIASAIEIERVGEMAGNPLLLTLMAILARTDELPRNRIRLFGKAAELLLYQWDTTRSLRPIGAIDFAYEQKHRVLRELAWRMQSSQLGLAGNLASLDMVREVFDHELKADIERPGDRARGVSLLIETLRVRDHVLCHVGGDRFAFVHRGFLEYFCADWCCERVRKTPGDAEGELGAIFQRHVNNPVWSEVLALTAMALSCELSDRILSQIEGILTKRGSIPKWLTQTILSDAKSRLTYPKTFARLRSVNLQRLRHDNDLESVNGVIRDMFRLWSDDETKEMLIDIVKTGESSVARRCAVLMLGRRWNDSETRVLITKIAGSDQGIVGRSAINSLAASWPDETTKDFLTKLATRADESNATAAAVTQLGTHWNDETTRALLISIANRGIPSPVTEAALRLQILWEQQGFSLSSEHS